jgi:hypothetical protein
MLASTGGGVTGSPRRRTEPAWTINASVEGGGVSADVG